MAPFPFLPPIGGDRGGANAISAAWRGISPHAAVRRHRERGARRRAVRFRSHRAGPGLGQARGARQPRDQGNTCHLGNGIKHVVQLGFDNVHFFRDNPNVPSDLQQMPALLDFFEHNGVFLSNSHTPLIAHTADDLLTTATGLYGDRQGNGVSNSYQAYNADGTTDPATSFTYWTDPIDDTARTPNAGHDTNPNLVYSPVPPGTANPAVSPTTVAPAPWVPYTRAGCNVGEVATVNQELENADLRHSEVLRRELARGPAGRGRPGLVQGPGGRGLHRRRGALRQGRGVLRRRHRREVRADDRDPDRGVRPAARRARRLQRLPGPVRPPVPVSLHRRRNRQRDPGRRAGHQQRRESDRRVRQPAHRRLHLAARLPRLRRDQRGPDAVLRRGHADPRRAGSEHVHRRYPRQRGHQREPAGQRPESHHRLQVGPCGARQRQPVLHRPGQVLQRRVRDLLQAARRRGHHAEEHAVRAQLGRGRPRGRRQRRARDPAHPGWLRRRDGGVHLPGRILRRTGRQRDRAARGGRQHDAVLAGGRHRAGVLPDRQPGAGHHDRTRLRAPGGRR